MARIMVLKHVAAEPLGLLDPMIRARGHRIRYVNFHRQPDAQPALDRYQALVVLGGPMNVGEDDKHPHLRTECALIEEALARQLPILGICLGAQLLAHVLGARVARARRPEIGWYPVQPRLPAVQSDPVLHPLQDEHPVFQWHGYGFDIPAGAKHLAESEDCPGQAMSYQDTAWGFQFHLELDEGLIRRWLHSPGYLADLRDSGLDHTPAKILDDTQQFLPPTQRLAERVFGNWLDRLAPNGNSRVLPSR
ncbi:gamma-glutamyl-gamma-aminobutyrate hydrolase family protein [Thioalkalivibrio sp. XN8]|uniref:type 1 glutamine amidotransferase n=1 Tax=Thioalkalivibrio sp. XN8 TaxID=2712863 RepID=UPI0013EAD314|nr:gamma-glutamyl-gamma-aminobutyrate hydrolase family protein [Thioalkalivibrio sp. XN8]NGP52674.1 C26 family cysteine hydrolase domain-containing family [Thioalkalivibrio sp. XN8]